MKKYILIALFILLFAFGCKSKNKEHIHDLVHHEGIDATCTTPGYLPYDTCSRCDYTTFEEIPALDHDLIHHEGIDATCTTPGYLSYDTCSRCDYTTFEEIPALDHDLVHHEGIDATCTTPGYLPYDTCSRCDYTTFEEIPALDHDLMHHEAKDPTYMKIGWEAYDESLRCNFTTYHELPKLDHKNYKNKTILNRDYYDYDFMYEDVLYAKTRSTNTMIVYNNFDYIKTNIYGKEALINEYGRVVSIDINVDATKGYMVISAHGTRTSEITNLHIGDYVIYYSDIIYVYRSDSLPFTPIVNDIFCRFYDLERYIETLDEGIERSAIIDALNKYIPYLEKIYDNETISDNIINEIKESFYSFNIESKRVVEYCNKQEELSEGNNKYSYIYNVISEEDYSLVNIYKETLYYGGFRNANTLVFYNSEYWRERNTYGYEIAIDCNGYVIDKEILVELPEGGFILSGHGTAAQFLKKVHYGDYVEVKDDKVYFYSKIIGASFNELINKANLIINEINYDLNDGIKHDYDLINNIINEINNNLPNTFTHDYLNIDKSLKQLSNVSSLVKKLASLSIAYDNTTVHGMWYYPLRDNNENTVQGLSDRLDLIKSMGINNIFITPLASDGAIFPNSMYVYSPKAQSNNYEGYKNYLDCFISLAHSKGIKVTAFTQTFMHYNNLMICNEDWTYQIEIDGTRSKGGVNYLDICNDNIKQMLYDYYSELLEYDFDGMEYDIIRYPESNLWKYLNVEKVSQSSVKDPGWSEHSVNKFMDLNDIQQYSTVKSLVLDSLDMRIKWLDYKEEELIDFITNTTKLIKEKNPDIVISAAILCSYDSARSAYLQDYKKWLELGIVDVVEPMNYTSELSEFEGFYNWYYNEEYADKTRMGMSNLLNGNDITEDFLQLKYAMKYGFVIFSNNQYLYNYEYIRYMQLLYKGDR